MANTFTNWSFIKNEIIKHWPKLAADEVDATNGDIVKIIYLIRESYGVKTYESKLEEIYIESSDLTYAGSRDNSAERKLNSNFSRTHSPSEEESGLMNHPTIFEDEDLNAAEE